MHMWPAAAASTASSRMAATETLIWLGGGMALFIFAVVAGWYMRRRFTRSVDDGPSVFTLDGIRRLRDRGELTVPEYESLRQRIIREMQGGGASGPGEGGRG